MKEIIVAVVGVFLGILGLIFGVKKSQKAKDYKEDLVLYPVSLCLPLLYRAASLLCGLNFHLSWHGIRYFGSL